MNTGISSSQNSRITCRQKPQGDIAEATSLVGERIKNISVELRNGLISAFVRMVGTHDVTASAMNFLVPSLCVA
jgi:hypothetical protein